jgi:hypothetical protein
VILRGAGSAYFGNIGEFYPASFNLNGGLMPWSFGWGRLGFNLSLSYGWFHRPAFTSFTSYNDQTYNAGTGTFSSSAQYGSAIAGIVYQSPLLWQRLRGEFRLGAGYSALFAVSFQHNHKKQKSAKPYYGYLTINTGLDLTVSLTESIFVYAGADAVALLPHDKKHYVVWLSPLLGVRYKW